MSSPPATDLINALRHNLGRIEEHGDEGLTPAALELKALILRRIAIIEAAIVIIGLAAKGGPTQS